MANVIRVTVDGNEDLLNAGMYDAGALVRVQSSTTETGTFANLTTAALVSGTRIYTVYDATGTSSTWYRTRYENSGGTRLSDWSAAFQVGGEEAGGLCSLYDVKQALSLVATDTNSDEELTEVIAEVTTDIQGYTGRRFVRSPLSGTSTFLFDVREVCTVLDVPHGIANLTTLEIATTSQPDTGGTYTTVTATDYTLRPIAHEREAGWPATRIVMRDNPSGSVAIFYPGYNVVRVTGALGWAAVPPDIAGMARRAVVRRFKNRAAASVNRGGDAQDVFARWTFSLEEKQKLMQYRVVAIG